MQHSCLLRGVCVEVLLLKLEKVLSIIVIHAQVFSTAMLAGSIYSHHSHSNYHLMVVPTHKIYCRGVAEHNVSLLLPRTIWTHLSVCCHFVVHGKVLGNSLDTSFLKFVKHRFCHCKSKKKITSGIQTACWLYDLCYICTAAFFKEKHPHILYYAAQYMLYACRSSIVWLISCC